MSNDQKKPEQLEASRLLATSTIADVLASRITELSTSPKMLEIIDASAEKFLKDVISDTFSTWGDFSKQAKEAFKAAMPGSIENVIELTRYNAMVQDRLQAVFAASGVANSIISKAEDALKEAMDETLLPPLIRLSDLLESFIEDHAERAREEYWERPDFRLIYSDNHLTAEYCHFYFAEKPTERFSGHRSQYLLENSFDMREVRGEMTNGDKVYEVYCAKIDDRFVQQIASTGVIRSKWKKMVFALYYGHSKIVIDCDPADYYYPGYD